MGLDYTYMIDCQDCKNRGFIINTNEGIVVFLKFVLRAALKIYCYNF